MTWGCTFGRFGTMFGTRPSVAVVKPIWYCAEISTLPNTCASGSHRKCMSSSSKTCIAWMLAPSNAQQRCGSSTPLGRPVVPEV